MRKACKSVNEIADELGVSPVYVESEAVFLYKYGFLLKKDGKIKEKRRDKMCRLEDKYASAVLAETCTVPDPTAFITISFPIPGLFCTH